jgi:hypothetical protein
LFEPDVDDDRPIKLLVDAAVRGRSNKCDELMDAKTLRDLVRINRWPFRGNDINAFFNSCQLLLCSIAGKRV